MRRLTRISRRLKGCKRDVDVWQRILKVRALVVTPRENVEMWVKFANLCRKSGRLGLADKTLNSLLGEAGPVRSRFSILASSAELTFWIALLQAMSGPPQVIYAHLKYMWTTGAREETLSFLREFTAKLANDLGLHIESDETHTTSRELAESGKLPEFTRLLARCYYKLGEWQMALQDNYGSVRTSFPALGLGVPRG